ANGTGITGVDELPGKANYFRGRDPAGWLTGVSTYRRVQYSNLYPGIDLVYYGSQRRLEYDFVLSAGADAGRIRAVLDGVDEASVGERGELILRVGARTLVQPRPRVYQEISGERQEVFGGYVLLAENEVGFELGEYDRAQRLTIDPVLDFSSYLGGSGSDAARGITLDSAGNVYLVGQTSSLDFLSADSSIQGAYGGGPADAFVVKLSADGRTVLYATYLGGTDDDVAYAVAVDPFGEACVTGYTRSADFPTVNAVQPH